MKIYIIKKIFHCSMYSMIWALWVLSILTLICSISLTFWTIYKLFLCKLFKARFDKLVTLFFFSIFLVLRKSTFFFMFKQKKKRSFFIRRKFFLKIIDFDIDVIRSCQYYFRVEKFYRVNNNSKKCVKCIRLSYVYDFVFLNFAN